MQYRTERIKYLWSILSANGVLSKCFTHQRNWDEVMFHNWHFSAYQWTPHNLPRHHSSCHLLWLDLLTDYQIRWMAPCSDGDEDFLLDRWINGITMINSEIRASRINIGLYLLQRNCEGSDFKLWFSPEIEMIHWGFLMSLGVAKVTRQGAWAILRKATK